MASIDALRHRIDRMLAKIEPARRSVTIIADNEQMICSEDGRQLNIFDVELLRAQGHRLVWRMIPDGYLKYI